MEIPKTKSPLAVSPKDAAFAAAMLLCGFLFWNFIMDAGRPGTGIALFAFILFALTFIYLSKKGFHQTTQSIIVLVLAALCALQFVLFDFTFISLLNFIFGAMLFVYWVMITTGNSITEQLSVYFSGDVVAQGLVVPFCNFGTASTALASSIQKERVKGLLLALVGVLFFFPLLAAVVSLLMSADFMFESFVTELFDLLHTNTFMPYLWHFVLGIPVAFYLFGLVFGNVKKRYTDSITTDSMDRAAGRARFAPSVTIYSALIAFCVVYLIFFIVQAAYLFSGFGASLPETFTYAEYARRGFFELCTVAGINLVVLGIAHVLMKRDLGDEPRELRIATVVISVFTLLLIATALSKMVMYIDAYGLTLLRTYTSWFMVLLFFIFSVIVFRQFKRFNASRIVIVGFVVLFMLLAFANVDGVIANYNISKYEREIDSGIEATFDLETLMGLSDATVPSLYQMYQRLGQGQSSDAALRAQLKEAILDREDTSSYTFRSFSYQRYRADQIAQSLR